MTYNPRPPACRGCPFDSYSHGFVPPWGPEKAPLLFLGEAPAKREVDLSQPFVGESGAVINRIFHFLSTSREFVRLANVVNCRSPDETWHRSMHAPAAIAHCHDAHLRHVLAEPHQVVVTLGAVPTKHILGLDGVDNFSIKDFHGTVHRDPTDRFWVVPTFHPAHLLRGAWSLLGTMIYDITSAMEIARAGSSWRPAPAPRLVVDPSPEWWAAWVDQFIALSASNPGAYWLSVDTETPRKTKRGDEGELKGEDRGEAMTRLNAACGPEEGISVTNHECYRAASTKLMACANPKMLWNGPFDTDVLVRNHMPMAGQLMDFMWGWHVLQSDVPRGLGFAAPNYLPWRQAWKHLSSSEPGPYAAWDGVNNWVTGMGVAQDLIRLGMWSVFYDHIHRADQQIFFPATRVGLLVDKPALVIYGNSVKASLAQLIVGLREPVPESVRNLHPPGGWKKDPGVTEKPDPDWDVEKDGAAPLYPVFSQQIQGAIVNVCQACGAEQIQKRHRCADKTLTPFVIADERTVTRWYIRKPFNPGSSPQLLALISALGYKAPISKKTKKPTTEKLGIEELARKTKDPEHKAYFAELLVWKEAKKVQGNYVNGTWRRLETDPRSIIDGRLHGETTHAPSTLRTSMRNPNLQNVTIHGSLSSGFRKCLVAAPGHKLIGADYCVAPEAKILKSDLTWARADAIRVGDELIGFDEELARSSNFRASTVKAIKYLKRPCVRVTTTEGSIVVATQHPFAARRHKHNRRWITAEKLVPGMQIAFLARPWETDTSWEGGYLAGFLDGEGWVAGASVGYGQNPGSVLSYVQALIAARGYPFFVSNGNSTAHCEVTGGIRNALRLLGSIRPKRLLEKSRRIWEGRRTWGRATPIATVLSIEPVEQNNVVAIETTTQTYISNGFFSHNSGIEALLVGWFARDPVYMRLARLGVHAYLASHVLGMPADLRASDKELKDYLKQFKEKDYEEPYDRCKRVVHGTNYGLTPYGMAERFPKFFPSRVIAEKIQQLYYKLCPKLRAWQQSLKVIADKYHFLGGPGGHSPHPFGYKHWFFNVREFRPITAAQAKFLENHDREWAKLGDNYYKIVPGDDAKRVLAFPPQSTARGVAVEAGLRLTDPACENTLVGFGNAGDTPFRALVHDEWLLEVPDHLVQEAATRLVKEMCRPVRALPLDKSWWSGPEEYLSIGVEVFIGQNWDKKSGMEKMDLKGIEIPEVWELVKDLDDVKREDEALQDQDPEDEGYEESTHDEAVRRALAG